MDATPLPYLLAGLVFGLLFGGVIGLVAGMRLERQGDGEKDWPPGVSYSSTREQFLDAVREAGSESATATAPGPRGRYNDGMNRSPGSFPQPIRRINGKRYFAANAVRSYLALPPLKEDRLATAPEVREWAGGVSDMTLWRWLNPAEGSADQAESDRQQASGGHA